MNFHEVLRKENIVKEKKESEAKTRQMKKKKHTPHPELPSYHCGQTCSSESRQVEEVEERERNGEEEAGEEGERHGHEK